MDLNVLNNKILIIKDESKSDVLKRLSNNKKLINVKIITLTELLKKYYFDYNKETIVYICNKYNVVCDVAKLYIKNMYYINDSYDDDRISFLKNMKKDLLENKKIKENKLFKSFLKNKDIIIYNCKNVDKMYKNIFDEISSISNVTYMDEEINNIHHDIYKCNSIEEEISFVASRICKLINTGIDINHIYLTNVTSSNNFIIKKTFKLFNIPINIKNTITCKGSIIINEFKNNYNSDISSTLESIKKYIITDQDKDLYKSIINVINEYAFISDFNMVKDFIFNDIDNIKLNNKCLKNAVNICDINDTFTDEDYVFLINFNEGSIPLEIKDEDYLSDKEKISLGISPSYEINSFNMTNLINKLSSIKNLIISYSAYENGNELYISNAYNENDFSILNNTEEYNYSNNYNKLKLVSLKDNYNKFGTINNDLIVLNNKYKDEKYLTYDNKYKLIDINLLKEHLGNKLSLSYTSINSYYECNFKYYLSNIIKVDNYENTFDAVIGNIFHKVLSECFTDDYDFEEGYKRAIENEKYEYNSSEKYFLKKLKKDLLLIIDTIKKQLEYTQLKKSMYENHIEIVINERCNVKFHGYVDKVIYDEIDGKTICFIVDYKTGDPKLNLNNCVIGLNMQLPCYIYLIKNKIKDVKIGGFYLQHILSPSKTEEEKINNLKLQGYTSVDKDIASIVDSSYMNSEVIKSLKVKNDGEFYSYSKTVSEDDINTLYGVVSDNISRASVDILNAKFDINPKVIKKENVSCQYCKYKDICYLKNEDIVEINNVSNIFGGNNDESMD